MDSGGEWFADTRTDTFVCIFMMTNDHGRLRVRRGSAAVVNPRAVRMEWAAWLAGLVVVLSTFRTALPNDTLQFSDGRILSRDQAYYSADIVLNYDQFTIGGEIDTDSPELIFDPERSPHFRRAGTLGQQSVTSFVPPQQSARDATATIDVTTGDAPRASERAPTESEAGNLRDGHHGQRGNLADNLWRQIVMPTDGRQPTESPSPRPANDAEAAPMRLAGPPVPPIEKAVGGGQPIAEPGRIAKSMPAPRHESEPKPTPIRQQTPEPATPMGDQHAVTSSLLKPFYMTNHDQRAKPISAPRRTGTSVSAQANRPSERNFTLPLGTLFSQWTMSTSDDVRPNQTTPSQPRSKTESRTRDENWTVAVPSMINPFTQTHEQPPKTAAGGAILMSYEEEELPAPAGPSIGDGGTGSAGATQTPGEGATGLAEADKLGEEPDDTSLQFLRTSTVLLKPGDSQFDIGITYLLTENTFPILLVDGGVAVGAEDVEFRVRELTVPMQYRFGVAKRVQAFIGMPVGWTNTQVAIDTFEAFQNDGGIGDLDFGATVQLIDGNAEKSHMLATVSVTAPTGGDPFGATAALASSAPSLGQGFWSISGNVLCIKIYDPLVFYYGVGTEQYIGRDFNGLEIDPGASWNYRFGLGFAVNDRVTLSTRFQGAYVEEVQVERERVLGSNFEPMSLRMAATISKPCKRIVEPFVEFGLTEGAVSSYFGVTWTF